MTGVLKDLSFTIAYLDDIIIFSRMAEEHLSHIKQVFEKLKNAHLSMKLSKCHFFLKEIQSLGHVFSTKGIRILPSKTQAIMLYKVLSVQINWYSVLPFKITTPRITPCNCERVVKYSRYFYSHEYANGDPTFRTMSHKVMTS